MSDEYDMNANESIVRQENLEEEERLPENPRIVPNEEKEELLNEAKEFHRLTENFDKEFNSRQNGFYYIISATWLRKWKRYTQYDNVTRGAEPDTQWLGQVPPRGAINREIVQRDSKFVKYPNGDDYRNVFLQPELQDQRDYEIVTESAWSFLAGKYDHITVKRPAYTLNSGMKRVEVALMRIQFVPINNSRLKLIDSGRSSEFELKVIQVFSQDSVEKFKEDLIDIFKNDSRQPWFQSSDYAATYFEPADDNIRLWKLEPGVALDQYFATIKDICKKHSSYEYDILFKGDFLEKEKSAKLEEAQIAPNDFLIVEASDGKGKWTFYGDGVPKFSKCSNCYKVSELTVHCICKEVSYCSESCRNSDKNYHRSRCSRADDFEEEEMKGLSKSEHSKQGLVGLQNLGNTCFMNSGLQCLSNSDELTKYFLQDKYLAEINETNPLGTKGKLVKKYATFLKNLWFGNSNVYSPWALKQGISEFQPMFSGYQQHDSQELLAFLLDGIHEDLNRVKSKPFTETIESDDHNDYETAMKSWENHLKRNQSVVVDLFHGQFKSQITCPTCNRVSVTFDPFSSVSLPIPQKKEKDIDVIFIYADNKSKGVKINIKFDKENHSIANLKEDLAKKLNVDPGSFYFILASESYMDCLVKEQETTTNEVRKKTNIRNLVALQFPEEDFKADPDDRVEVQLHTMKKKIGYANYERIESKSFIRPIVLLKSQTLKQAYIKVFRHYRFLFDENWPEEDREEFRNLSDEAAFDKLFLEGETKPFYIRLVSKSYDDCYYCGKNHHDNCLMPCDDNVKVEDLLKKIEGTRENLELEWVFNDLPDFVDLAPLNHFVDYSKKKPTEDKDKGAGSENVTIRDCFEKFEMPEQLGEDNAWYCNKCKEHQRATKKMEIYKAPPILILHFKRFKSGTSLFRKGKITEKVEFPIKNLDISEYVIHHELPTDYPVDRIIPQFDLENSSQQSGAKSNNTDRNVTPTKDRIEVEDSPLKGKSPPKSDSKTPQKASGQMSLEDVNNPNGDPRLLYDLFAVVNHFGNMGFGHYTAYGKNSKKDRWYYFDDSRVTEDDAENVCTPAAYVLFYKRKNWNP